MATIEERAKELYPDAFDDDEIVPAREGYIVKIQRLAYIEGATAQKQIDIDKACEWLAEHAKAFGSAEATDVWEATYKYDSKLLVEQFKKTMEE